MLDEVGFGFSAYDGIGAFRTKDASGQPVDTRGNIFGFSEPAFTGPRELGAKLRASPTLSACMATQMFRYALARSETADDACTLQLVAADLAQGGHTFATLVESIVKRDAFRFRRPPLSSGGMN
jgi:hypothetical protein